MPAMRSEAVAMANAFSMPSADSRIGISQIGRVTPDCFAIRVIASLDFAHLRRRLDLRNQDEVGRLGNDFFQIGQSQRQLIDAHHALGRAEIHRAQRIAHQQARRIFLGVVDRVFEIEDDRVGPVQSRVDEVLGLVARQIKPRAAQAVARRSRGQRKRVGQRRFLLAQSGATHRRLHPRRDDEGQRAFIHDADEGMLDAQRMQHIAHLLPDVLAVIQRHPRAQLDLDAAAGALFHADVQVGAHIAARASRLAAFQLTSFGCCRHMPSPHRRPASPGWRP